METQVEKKREGTTIYLNKKLLDAVKSLVYFRKAKGEKITISQFLEEAIREKLEKEGVDI
jgi:hypothetical protein